MVENNIGREFKFTEPKPSENLEQTLNWLVLLFVSSVRADCSFVLWNDGLMSVSIFYESDHNYLT